MPGRKLREEKIATEGVYPCSTFPVAQDDIESGKELVAFRKVRRKNRVKAILADSGPKVSLERG